jgi:hypothetical protein
MAETTESILAARRGARLPWTNQGPIELYLQARDEDKAAALDAAIEFEDTNPDERIDDGRRSEGHTGSAR